MLRIALVPALVVASMLLVACGGDDDRSSAPIGRGTDLPTARPASEQDIADITGVWDGTVELEGTDSPAPFCLELSAGAEGSVEAAAYLEGERQSVVTGTVDAAGLLLLHSADGNAALEGRARDNEMTGQWSFAAEGTEAVGGPFALAKAEGTSC